jgi:signal transduction histidine kinase
MEALENGMDAPENGMDTPENGMDARENGTDVLGSRMGAAGSDRMASRLDRAARRPRDVMLPVDINAIARDAIRLAQLEDEAQIALRASFFNPLPRVQGSPEPLARAICNLLVNARKSLDGIDGGVIEIETEPDGDLVAVRILDNGPGMSEALLERIFDPFACEGESDDESDSKALKDASGLSDACEIIRDHSGTLTVRSRPGEGTCFVALIPIQRG